MSDGRHRQPIWRSVAVLTVVLAAGLLCTMQPPGWRTLLTYELPGFGAAVAVLFGVRCYRPQSASAWRLLALGIMTSVLADFLWDSEGLLPVDPKVFGHLVDACYLLTYPAYLLAAVWFLGGRASKRDTTLLLDGAIYALAGWLALWVLVVHPQLAGGGLGAWDWLPTVLYPPLDVMVLILVWRLGRGDIRRTAPWLLISAAFTTMFVADGLYALLAMPTSGWVSDALDVSWLMAYAGLAAAAVHPGMRYLIANPEPTVRDHDRVRVVALGLALVTPFLLILLAPEDLDAVGDLLVPVGLLLVLATAVRFTISSHRNRDAETALAFRATHDSLTGLANRASLLDCLELATRRAARNHESCSVLFLDLDDFKIVNDSLGHAVGDQLLRTVADRLRRFARAEECVARLGGDEFVVVLEGIRGIDDAIEAAERLVGLFDESFSLGATDVHLTASVGVVPDAERSVGDVESVLRDADLAMYEAKQSEARRISIFEPTMHQHAIARLEIKNALRTAISDGELRLVFQPIFDTVTRRPIASEALLRWHRADGSVVAPLDFIPIAEASHAILPIGEWVVETAARELASIGASDLAISVNVSPRQLADPNFADHVLEACRRTGLAPERMILELTESALVEPDPTVDLNLEALGAAGFQMAIDDFGTGYSSLAYLTRLEIDWIKIDQIFVSGLGRNPSDETLVRAIIHMAHDLGLRVIAEGVETQAQLEVLTNLGRDAVQGFLLARPSSQLVAVTDELAPVESTGAQYR